MENKQKTPRRSPRNLVIQSTGSEELNVGPNFSLGISPDVEDETVHAKKKGQKMKSKRGEVATTSKRARVVNTDDDFEDFPPQFQKKGKTTVDAVATKRNRLPKNVNLPESKYSDRKFWRHPDVIYVRSRWSSYTNIDSIDQIKATLSEKQLTLFRNTCFGYFLDLPKVTTQLQLIHCLVNKELKHTPDDVFAVEINDKRLFFGLREFGIITGLNCVSDGSCIDIPDSRCSLLTNYFSDQTSVHKNHLREVFFAKNFLDDDSAVSLAVLFFIHEFLFSYENSAQTISHRDFYLVESGKFNSYTWGLDVFHKLLDDVRHKLTSTNQYYRLGGLPIALQVWIYECCSNVGKDITIRVFDGIPRILRWKIVAENPWLKHIENGLFMPTKNKFENIVTTEEEISKFKLPEPRDYNAEILKLEPKGSSHGLGVLTKEVIELRKELVKANENHKALEQKIDLEFLKMREFVVNSNKKLLEDIDLLVGKGDASSFNVRKVKEMSKKEACETFSGGLNCNEGFSPCMDPSPHVSREHDAQVMGSNQHEEFQVFTVPVVFVDVENSERISSKTGLHPAASGIAIEQVLSEVAADINGQEAADVNEVDEKADDTVKDCQKSAQTLDDFVCLDEDLSQINRTEASYLNKKAPVEQNKKKVTPKKRGRKKNPRKLITSPYTPHFESGGTLCVTRQIFPTKHPFSYAIGVDDESDLVNSFTSLLYMDSKKRGKKSYPAAVNVMKPGFELGICTVEAKEWFFKLAHPGQEWSDECA